MWVLVFSLFFAPTSDYVPREPNDFRYINVREVDYETCVRERDWWLENFERLPPGVEPGWHRLTGPDCVQTDDLKNPVPVA